MSEVCPFHRPLVASKLAMRSNSGEIERRRGWGRRQRNLVDRLAAFQNASSYAVKAVASTYAIKGSGGVRIEL